jgi:hypothetical protein
MASRGVNSFDKGGVNFVYAEEYVKCSEVVLGDEVGASIHHCG